MKIQLTLTQEEHLALVFGLGVLTGQAIKEKAMTADPNERASASRRAERYQSIFNKVQAGIEL